MFLRPQALGEDPATVPYQYERARSEPETPLLCKR